MPDFTLPPSFYLIEDTAAKDAVEQLVSQQQSSVSGQYLYVGDGSPEGVLIARRGALYVRRDGGAGTCLYVQETGGGTPDTMLSTGWVAK